MKFNRIQVSKFLSYILRHRPDKFTISLDEYGYALQEDIVKILQKKCTGFQKNDLLQLVELDPKGRFELKGENIRATYGHSIKVKPISNQIVPPDILYHGTSPNAVDKIREQGIRSMHRQYVHLSVAREDARQVGLRRSSDPIILEVKAWEASQQGILFYQEGKMYLTEHVPREFILFQT